MCGTFCLSLFCIPILISPENENAFIQRAHQRHTHRRWTSKRGEKHILSPVFVFAYGEWCSLCVCGAERSLLLCWQQCFSIFHIHLCLCLRHTESEMKHSFRRCECHRDLAQLINKTYAFVRERLPTNADGCPRHPFAKHYIHIHANAPLTYTKHAGLTQCFDPNPNP